MLSHFANSLWSIFEPKTDIATTLWPEFDEKHLQAQGQVIAVQINGKLRATFEISLDTSKESQEKQALRTT